MENPELFMPELTKREHIAIKAVAKGEADADQQVLMVEVIVQKLCTTHDLSYLPGDLQTASAFKSGRQFVGYKLIKFIKMAVANNKKGNQ